MKLFHYAPQRWNVLKTKRKQLLVTERDIVLETRKNYRQIAPYYDHISFFFEPIPAKHMGYFFRGVPHRTWRKGAVLYEYQVDTDNFDFGYMIVETEGDYNQLIKDWPTTATLSEAQIERYKVNYYKRKIKTGEASKTKDNFEKMANPYVGKLLQNYIKASGLYEYEEEKHKYAAFVPHVMIYPKTGMIEFDSVKRITIDNQPVRNTKL